jgi:deferrochelatase/peroxidase EfeB
MPLTRRGFVRSAGLAGLGAGAGFAVGQVTTDDRDQGPAPPAGAAVVAFFGAHQAGIATPSQEFVQFGAFDLVSESLTDLRGLLARWSAAAALLARGRPVGPMATGSEPPGDTGESAGLGPSAVTVTIGLGPSLFGAQGRDRLGLGSLKPAPLVELPPFAGDALVPGWCGGDLGAQVCADDPQVAFHALHSLVRIAAPAAVPRWALAGAGRTKNDRGQVTPRNLMGFKDGTANIMAADERALDRFVWASSRESPPWMAGGSYLVVRRIAMMLGAWDATSLDDQEATFGRRKLSGAPLTGSSEGDPVDLRAMAGGLPVIPADAHIRLASPAYNGGQRILRRGYSYVDGTDPVAGTLAGGLLFLCFQRDPRRQFIPIQRRLAGSDALNRHIQHVGSAVFACPPGAAPGGFVGEGLFG